jgi:hypothetical protein
MCEEWKENERLKKKKKKEKIEKEIGEERSEKDGDTKEFTSRLY